ncbi:MAG: response regulator transcription factor [Anaerolineales bacterium]
MPQSSQNPSISLYQTPPPAHILVVEDDPQVQRMVRRQLREQPYELTLAQDAQQAWHHLQTTTFDLVVLDVMLPGMDGFALCARLREQFAPLALPVLVLSALGEDAHTQQRGLDVGANAFLGKPYSAKTLIQQIESLLQDKRMHERVKSHTAAQVLGSVHQQIMPDSDALTEQLNAALLVIDLAAFLPPSGEALPPDSLNEMDALLHQMMACIEAYGGGAVEGTHHQLMAGFNVLHPLEDPLTAALDAALALQDLIGGTRAAVPMGVHGGPVSVRRWPGGSLRYMRTVQGTTVDVVRQMARLALPGSIALSATAYAAASAHLDTYPSLSVERLFGVPVPESANTQTVYQVRAG